MDYTNTLVPFLREDCVNEFGKDKGMKIYNRACDIFSSLLAKADYRDSEIIKKHITQIIFPTIAYYLSLQSHGYSKEEANSLTRKETQKAAHIQKKKNEAIAKFPFAFQIFKLSIRGILKKMYPVDGWETEWVQLNNQEIHMNFKRCLHLDLTIEHGCPELCSVFCETDTITFAGYEPKIRFRRSGTLAEGNSCCDFHFIRGM